MSTYVEMSTDKQTLEPQVSAEEEMEEKKAKELIAEEAEKTQRKYVCFAIIEVLVVAISVGFAIGLRIFTFMELKRPECYETIIRESKTNESYVNGRLVKDISTDLARFIGFRSDKGFIITRTRNMIRRHWGYHQVFLFASVIIFTICTLYSGAIHRSLRFRDRFGGWKKEARFTIQVFLSGAVCLSIIGDCLTILESLTFETIARVGSEAGNCGEDILYPVIMLSYMIAASSIIFITVGLRYDHNAMHLIGRILYITLVLGFCMTTVLWSYMIVVDQTGIFYSSAYLTSQMATYTLAIVFGCVWKLTPHNSAERMRSHRQNDSPEPSAPGTPRVILIGSNVPLGSATFKVFRRANGQVLILPVRTKALGNQPRHG